MIRLRLHRIFICGVVFVWVGYVIVSYHQEREEFRVRNAQLLIKTKEEVNEAVEQFFQFLSLTEKRLLDSLDAKENIVPILSLQVEHYLRKKFPCIVSLSFVLASEPKIIYSRFGKSKYKGVKQKSGVTHLEKGVFEITKILYDRKKAFGVLQSTFSIHHVLGQEVEVYAISGKGLREYQLFFTVKNLPYIFILKQSPPSFWAFLLKVKLQILWSLLYGVSMGMLGYLFERQCRRRMLTNYRRQIRQLKENLGTLRQKQQFLETQAEESKSLLALKKTAYTERLLLWANVWERYRNMLRQSQAILNLTERLVIEGTGDDQRRRIHEIFQESAFILRLLAQGFPMKGSEEEVDIVQSLDTVMKIFLPQFVEQKVQVEIKDIRKKKEQFLVYLDKIIFNVVLHNIFYLIGDRLIMNNLVTIEIKGSNPLQMVFYDNGHEIKDKVKNVIQGCFPRDTLCLGKQYLRDLIGHLGWQISFYTGKNALNIISLSIPKGVNEQDFPSNVVKLFT